MNEKYKEKEITNLLYDLRDEPWFKYLNGIRNCLAHHKLSEFATAKDLKLYLPSNPEELDKPGSYSLEKEFEVLPCLENLSINVKEFLEKGCGLLIDEIDNKYEKSY